MLDVEVQAYNTLPPAKRERFEFLLNLRNALALTNAELCCWGLVDNPMIDRQLVLLEDALMNLIKDVRLEAALFVEWAEQFAGLLHVTGTADWCSVCRNAGSYGLDDMLGTLILAVD